MSAIRPNSPPGPKPKKGSKKAKKSGLRRRKKGPTKPLDSYVPWSNVLKRPADDACFPIYRGMSCLMCGGSDGVAGHHIIPRSESARYRHDIRNLVPICKHCHCAVENQVRDRALLMEKIRQSSSVWYDALLSMMEESKLNRTGKPDFHAAIAFWTAHESSGHTVEYALNEALLSYEQLKDAT